MDRHLSKRNSKSSFREGDGFWSIPKISQAEWWILIYYFDNYFKRNLEILVYSQSFCTYANVLRDVSDCACKCEWWMEAHSKQCLFAKVKKRCYDQPVTQDSGKKEVSLYSWKEITNPPGHQPTETLCQDRPGWKSGGPADVARTRPAEGPSLPPGSAQGPLAGFFEKSW